MRQSADPKQKAIESVVAMQLDRGKVSFGQWDLANVLKLSYYRSKFILEAGLNLVCAGKPRSYRLDDLVVHDVPAQFVCPACDHPPPQQVAGDGLT
jgi:hypothetical protein